MVVLALIGVVLLQKSEGGGLGIGSTGGFLSSRGTANVLTRTTAYLALAFFATSLALSWIASFDRKPTSILNTGAPAGQTQPAGPAPTRRSRPAAAGCSSSCKARRRRSRRRHPAGRRCRSRSSARSIKGPGNRPFGFVRPWSGAAAAQETHE